MVDMKQLPGLLKQEKESLSCLYLILFKHYDSSKDESIKGKLLNEFLEY